ncbi:hypothetical protein KQH42_30095 [Streptomyces sp. CHA1]|uniref:hypothetical protein n=1 Tax=unclassified Streptomyces TaxID=2593676 RepID=UPI0018C1A168|nr:MULTISPECIES: hypothetical protein [unclassified Streptomyces]QPA00126.1 hypothetical protein DI273_14505 [Streptomyces violascens]MBT3160456.1 hypothetical protein [Streptomyces sp. G11C]MCO6704676.1 hypothetical protein [Streptomyces sp. CHB9.2]MCO6710867.1 hypothetical protein [Streptomyces sp. CHA3]MCO6716726.1 hypothetical protein [Streptomyces sp. CHB19.2]
MNVKPLLDALGLQEDAARALADDLRTRIEELHGQLREVETHREHLAITRKTITTLADRIPAQADSPDLPEHPDYPRILAVFTPATGPLRARDVCEALDHEPLPKNIEGTRAKLKRLVKLGILTEIDTGSFTRKL